MKIKHIVVLAAVSFLIGACGSSPSSGGSNPAGEAPQVKVGHAGHGGLGKPPPPAAALRANENFVEVGLQNAYAPKPPEGATDEYRCFLVDPKFTENMFLTGFQYLPGNAEIVHHGGLYNIPTENLEKARTVDGETPGDGWPCFSGVGLNPGVDSPAGGPKSGATYINSWSPGNNEALYQNAGYPIKAGSQFIVQLHYSLLFNDGKTGPTDQTKVRLRVAPAATPLTPLEGRFMSAPVELPCAAGESGPLCDREAAVLDLVKRTGSQAIGQIDVLNRVCNGGKIMAPSPTQACDWKYTKPVMLYAVAPHMHLLGKSIKVELNPGTPNAQVLLDQQQYNFDDQSAKLLNPPVQIKANDVVRVTCTHDAGLRQILPELKNSKPRFVTWGDGTSDEMCTAVGTLSPQA